MDEQSPTLTDFARHSPIPRKVLLYLHRQQLIQDPPCREDLLGLRLLEQVWGNKAVPADTAELPAHRQPEHQVGTVRLFEVLQQQAGCAPLRAVGG